MPRPDLQTVPIHLHEEINLVEQDDLKAAFLKHSNAVSFLKEIPEGKWNFKYAEGKWNIKGVVQHIIDAERIFCNRALVIVRKDRTTPLPSFDGDQYEETSKSDKRTKYELIREFSAIQLSSRELFESFDNEQLMTVGIVNNYTIDVNALGFVILGHTLHHLRLIRERYL